MKRRHLRNSVEMILWGIVFTVMLAIGSLIDIEPAGILVIFGLVLILFCTVFILSEFGTMGRDEED